MFYFKMVMALAVGLCAALFAHKMFSLVTIAINSINNIPIIK